MARELAGLGEWTPSGGDPALKAYLELKALYGNICIRLASGDDLGRGIGASLLANIPLLLYESFGGEVDLASEPRFRDFFQAWVGRQARELRETALLALWRQLLAKRDPWKPSLPGWAEALATSIRDVDGKLLQCAKRTVLRYGIFHGGGGTASGAALDFARRTAASGEGGTQEYLTWSDRGFFASLKSVCSVLASAAPGPGPQGLLERLDSLIEDDDRVWRLIADDPERGGEILALVLSTLAQGLKDPEAAGDRYWFRALRGRVIRFAARTFSCPGLPSASCFWKMVDPALEALFGRALVEEGLDLFIGSAREVGEPAGGEDMASFWRRLVREGEVLDAWAALGEDATRLSGDPATTEHGVLTDGAPRTSVLFIRFPRLLTACWSDGTVFAWREGTPDTPELHLAEYSFAKIALLGNFTRHLPGPAWKGEVENLVARARAAPPRPRRE
jgi:hypothetical protein